MANNEPFRGVPSDLVERVRRVARRPVIVGIDGPGAAGKSVLAKWLRDALEDAAIVEVDDFYRPAREVGAQGAVCDLERLRREVLDPARGGRPTRYQRYDWREDRLAGWIDLAAHRHVIVEGVYALERSLRPLVDLGVFVDTPPALRLARGLARDGAASETQWLAWMAAWDAYVAAQRPDLAADVVIDGTRPL